MRTQLELKEICSKFAIYGDFLVAVPFGSGHINDTYQVTYDQGGVRLHYTLQRINHHVFKNPVQVMENVDRVTNHLLHKIRTRHIETKKRTLRLLRTFTNHPYVKDDAGNHWRAYVVVENARSYEVLESEDQAFMAAKAFGEFQCDLTDLPGPRLHETIVDFHNTPKRLEKLRQAIKLDKLGRAKAVKREIDFVFEREADAGKLIKLNQAGDIPERITHNDTKVNNILIDDLTGEGICVIDLDTVMPGLALYDFGDMVRAGTSPAEEDEVDLSKVGMRFSMFEAMLKGFLASSGGFLTPAERENLPFAGKLITLEVGMRFLTDYLEGDVYFKVKHERHNLDRCRNQFKLAESMEYQMPKMMKLL